MNENKIKQGQGLIYLGRGGEFDPEKNKPDWYLNFDTRFEKYDPNHPYHDEVSYFRAIDLRPRLQCEEPSPNDQVLVWSGEFKYWERRYGTAVHKSHQWLRMLPPPCELLVAKPEPKPKMVEIDADELAELRDKAEILKKMMEVIKEKGGGE